MSLSRKLIVHVLPALMLFVGVSPVVAAPAADHRVETGPADFFIDANQCPELPAGVSVTGTGERQTIINTHTKADGTVEIRTNDLAKGVATDSNGGVHKFVYHNSSTLTIPTSGDYSFSMNDSFELTGPGPHYSVGFNWRWTFDPEVEAPWPPPEDKLEQISTRGDIFKCDPL
jgi:hypothetical protein